MVPALKIFGVGAICAGFCPCLCCRPWRVTETVVLHGRRFQPQDLILARDLIGAHPNWSRYRLSRELCAVWDWRTATGQWQDMAARTVLLKLEQRGWLLLAGASEPLAQSPSSGGPSQRATGTGRRSREPGGCRSDADPGGELPAVRAGTTACRTGDVPLSGLRRTPVGENLQYMVRDRTGRLLAVAGVCGLRPGSARHAISGSDGVLRQREANLKRITNNVRFLLLPWVRVPQLGSWILGALGRRIAEDWQAQVRPSGRALGDLRGAGTVCWHVLSGGQLATGGTDDRSQPRRSSSHVAGAGEGTLRACAAAGLSRGVDG